MDLGKISALVIALWIMVTGIFILVNINKAVGGE
jgi:uncharacterized protein YoxC